MFAIKSKKTLNNYKLKYPNNYNLKCFIGV